MINLFGPNRRTIRLQEYDYKSEGAYFVTICTQDRQDIFGRITNGTMNLSAGGEMIQKAWVHIPHYDPHISLDEFIVMPNHIHGIICIDGGGGDGRCGRGQCPAPTISLSSIVGRFKSWTTLQYQTGVAREGWAPIQQRLWQRNYYERVIRTDQGLNRTREYIRNNPTNWPTDPENQLQA